MNKNKIDSEVLKIIFFQIEALGLEPTKENIGLALTMFIEGARFIREELKEHEPVARYKNEDTKYCECGKETDISNLVCDECR